MENQNPFAGLMGALSARIGVEPQLIEGKRAHLDAGNFAMSLEWLPDAGQILLSAAIAPITGRSREDLYRELLQGNFLFGATQGATLAVDKGENFVCLQIAPYLSALTLENFPTLVENFLNMAETWRKRCAGEDAAQAEQPQSPQPADGVGAHFVRV